MMVWDLSEAEQKFDKLVNQALTEGLQKINYRGDELVLISATDLEKISSEKQSFTKFLMSSPSLEGVDLERSKETVRNLGL